MLDNIIAVGKSIDSSNPLVDYLSVAKLGRTKSILSILIEGDSYIGIIPEDKKSDMSDIIKYLYSAGPSNGADKTPSSLITETEKTFNKKILKWFELYGNKNQLLSQIGNILRTNSEKIISDIENERKNIPKDLIQNILLTIKLKHGNEEIFIGQNPQVIEILKSQFETDTKDIDTSIFQCIFCGDSAQVIPDKLKISDIFSFCTFDKKGFLYGFDMANRNKQLPSCNNCYLNLKRGKEWLDKYTLFNFEGYKYYLIPSIHNHLQNQELLKEFINLAKIHESARNEKQTITRYETGLMQEEKDVLERMVETESTLVLEFLFVSLKGGGKYMDVERYIEDVPTTWIRNIYNVYNEILSLPLFKEENMKVIVGQKWEGNLKDRKKEMYLAGLIKLFFPPDSLDMEFLTFISHILKGKKIKAVVIYRAFLRKIRKDILENFYFAKMDSIKSLALLLVLNRLKLITYTNNSINGMSTSESSLSIEDNKFKEIEEILDSNGKKAVFYEGVLTGKLLAIQYASRSSTPFLDKLHGLHVSFNDAKILLPKIISKLRDYQAAYTAIEKQIAEKFIQSEKEGIILSDDESSYYFTLGMLLHSQIK